MTNEDFRTNAAQPSRQMFRASASTAHIPYHSNGNRPGRGFMLPNIKPLPLSKLAVRWLPAVRCRSNSRGRAERNAGAVRGDLSRSDGVAACSCCFVLADFFASTVRIKIHHRQTQSRDFMALWCVLRPLLDDNATVAGRTVGPVHVRSTLRWGHKQPHSADGRLGSPWGGDPPVRNSTKLHQHRWNLNGQVKHGVMNAATSNKPTKKTNRTNEFSKHIFGQRGRRRKAPSLHYSYILPSLNLLRDQ